MTDLLPVPISSLSDHSILKQSLQQDPGILAERLVMGVTQNVPVYFDLEKHHHLLIIGSQASGAADLLHTLVNSIFFTMAPSNARIIAIEATAELSVFGTTPYHLTEVITCSQKATAALQWTLQEIENRYKRFREAGVMNFTQYNKNALEENIPRIILMISMMDEITYGNRDSADYITRIVTTGAHAGVTVIGSISSVSGSLPPKLLSLLPVRAVFTCSSIEDARRAGMPHRAITLPPHQFLLSTGSGAMQEVDLLPEIEDTTQKVITYLKENNLFTAEHEITPPVFPSAESGQDPFFNEAVTLLSGVTAISASLLQRKLKVGYARASRILDELEAAGFVGTAYGSNPRVVLRSRNSQLPER